MKREDKILFAAGFITLLAPILLCAVLGENAVFVYHDQLDGEMIAYILQAKHLWSGAGLAEFMNGVDKTALMMPAPACVLFFLTGNYFAALLMMKLLGSVTAYLGMYLLSGELAGNRKAAVIAGTLYAWLPFLAVYGLSQYGLPMLLWCILQLKKNRWVKVSFGYGILFALCSSLALVGFAVLLCFAVWIIGAFCREKGKGTGNNRFLFRWGILWCILCAGYLLTNLSLIAGILSPRAGMISHKTEYALGAENFWQGFLDAFLYGGQHSGDGHLYFLCAVVAAVVLCLLRKNWAGKKMIRRLLVLLGCNVCLAAASALWNSGAFVALRTHFGALGAFQMDRLLWLSPCLWYLMLAHVLAAVWHNKSENKGYIKTIRRICFAVTVVAVAATGFWILRENEFKANLQKLRNPDYPAISYADYYAIGVLEQVEDFLKSGTGLEKEDYRVVSLGIDPAAALYHGFYCLDGYSNHYPLEYKHRFRRIIAPELKKSEYLTGYFDDWGNRCYLLSAECPAYYTIQKGGFYFQDLELDIEALRELGGDYLFSAAYIANAENLGLTLLREEAFETPQSYYRIFLYGTHE